MRRAALAAVMSLTAGVIVAIAAPVTTEAVAAGSPCGATINPIVCENQQPGSPPSQWDIDGAGDDDIQGFSTDVSVNVGSTISFKINSTTAKTYTIDLYRLGYYQGNGARKVGSITPSAKLPQTQPTCLSDPSTQLVDCGNWAVSASWAVPSTAVSGVYLAKLTRPDNGDASQITFIVRNDASTADIVYQTSDPTWEAYNVWGGNDFYTGNQALSNSQARAFKVSYNRPYATRGSNDGRDFLFSNEYPTLRFLERNGYDMSYIAGVDTDRAGSLLKNHKVFFSVGHDEYWSQAQRTNVEAARDAGVSLVFLSGNEVYWRTRYEPSIDGSNTPYRTLVDYKETWDDSPTDPVAPHSTATFRDPRFATGVNGGNPENGLTGTMYMSNDTDLAIQVSGAQGKLRLWRGTSLGSVPATTITTLAPHTIGYESDEDVDNGFRPAGLIDLSTTTGATPQYLQDFGSNTLPGTTTHHLTLYRAPSGALVFGAGTIQWGWGLDATHDGESPAPADSRMQQATVNLLADMKVQPATLMSGLVAASASTDTTGPTVTVTSPAAGATLAQGAAITVTGTAVDSGGGIVAGVEVSTDAGVTWHPATGTTSWTYSGFVRGLGTGTILARATDDSANTGATATPSTTSACPCTLFGAQTPASAAVDSGDASGTEVGTRFTVDRSGYVTGVRFYKASTNTGTHTGTLWAPDGTVLASGDFSGETASGWQTLTFPQSVAVTTGTVYTVSYYAPSGHYSATSSFWYYKDFSAAPLHAAPFSPTDPNAVAGVFSGSHSFPTTTYKTEANYWVDPVFTSASATPPAVTAVTPRNGATSVAANSTPVTVTFSSDVSPGQLSVSVKSGSAAVAGTVSYNSPSLTATFTPSQPWAAGTTYTVTVNATGTNGVAMTAPVTSIFATATTDGRCPCTIVDTSTSVPTTVNASDTGAVTVGVKFTADTNGVVLGVQFYKGPTNTGTHVGSLWSSTGAVLASATFVNESAQGWQYAAFSSPVSVTAGTTYTAGYRATAGRYAVTSGAFNTGRDRFPLHVPANGAVYNYGTGAPTTTSSSDYGVDVLFTVPSSVVPVPAATSPTASATGVSTTASIVATYNASVTNGSPTFTLKDSSGNVLPGTTTLDAVQQTATFDPTALFATGATYTVSVTGGTSLGGVVQTSPVTWSFTTAGGTGGSGGGGATGSGLFQPTDAPSTPDSGDTSAVSLGVKFTTSAAGSITGVRFYKATTNTGTHTVSLWATAAGTRLATATSTAETASGWQTATFASPVTLTVGTTYTVSYYAPRGHYSATGGYFGTALTNGPLTAPVGAGVYVYGSDALPASTYNNGNYWVDPLFVQTNPPAPPAPTVISRSPVPGATSVSTTTTVTAGFSADVVASSVSAGLTTTVGSGTPTAVAATTTYDPTQRLVTVTPAAALPQGATVAVSVSATGTNGTAMAAPDKWSFVTTQPASTPGVCPCSFWPDSAVPATVTANDTGSVELGVQFQSDSAGTVSAVRFYKGPQNTGTHIVYLTTTAGVRMASATATSETASGWQTVTFAQPVAIAANTLYLVSYLAPVGGYSYTSGQFASTGLDVAPLHIPGRGPSRYVYRSASATTTPTNTSDANYWVSPVFSPNG